MRIISKFHDYYDSIQKYGQDTTLTYVRKQEVIPLEKRHERLSKIAYREWSNVPYTGLSVRIVVTGFCGKIYKVALLEKSESYYDTIGVSRDKRNMAYCYNIDQVKSFIYSLNSKKIAKGMEKKVRGTSLEFTFQSAERALAGYPLTENDIFVEYNTPIFTYSPQLLSIREDAIIKNPELKILEFYKVVDPYTAYQEISMYLSGVLGVGEPVTVDISNKDMIHKKGFDKASFRAEKGDKKPRKSNRGKK